MSLLPSRFLFGGLGLFLLLLHFVLCQIHVFSCIFRLTNLTTGKSTRSANTLVKIILRA